MDDAATPSTRRLDLLASPDQLLVACRAVVLAEALLGDPFESEGNHWLRRIAEDEWMCSVDNGNGDEARYWFGPEGAVLRGFDHECVMSPWVNKDNKRWPGLEDGFPPPLRRAPSIVKRDVGECVTFVIWRTHDADHWSIGPVEFPPAGPRHADPDGSEHLLGPVSGIDPAHKFLQTMHGVDVPREAIAALFAELPLNHPDLTTLVADVDPATVVDTAERLGYPTTGPVGRLRSVP